MKRSLFLLVTFALLPVCVAAQKPAWRRGNAFDYRRLVEVPSGKPIPSVIVTAFYAHGQLDADATNWAVFDANGPVPARILQRGPGDFCRIAFQTSPGERLYQIYYGGTGLKEPAPKWSATTGLQFESYEYVECDLDRHESLRDAMQKSRLHGSDYVDRVFHGFNPIRPAPRPFLSRYHGLLTIDRPGKYEFYTSSQDASFLLIDGRVVVAAPGRHPPERRARKAGTVTLSKGQHRFEYLHAATGESAAMVAAWKPPGATAPAAIPPEAFGSHRVQHALNGSLRHRVLGRRPEFSMAVLGEVVLTDTDLAIVRVHFEVTPGETTPRPDRVSWEFGDGQTARGLATDHLFLEPGKLFNVELTVRTRPPTKIANQIWIDRPAVILRHKNERPDTLAQYVPILLQYDPSTLTGQALVAWATALRQSGNGAQAAQAVKEALEDKQRDLQDRDIAELAFFAQHLYQSELKDAASALQLLSQSVARLSDPALKGRCAIEAAELALNEILDLGQAGPLLQVVGRAAESGQLTPAEMAHYYRLMGDWHARRGERKQANDFYEQARKARRLPLSTIENNARRGAYSRSVEAFLRDKEWDRAKEQLDAWLSDFPEDKGTGYLSLLLAEYYAQTGRARAAIAIANDALVTRPDSPYADRLLANIGQWEEAQGRVDQAIARYQSLLSDYPGSPLVPQIKQKLQQLSRNK